MNSSKTLIVQIMLALYNKVQLVTELTSMN